MSLLMGDIFHELPDWRLGRLEANWLPTSHRVELITLADWVSTLWFIIVATRHIYILFCTETHRPLARLSVDWFHTWLLVCCRVELRCRRFRSDPLAWGLSGLCSVSLCVAIDNICWEIISCRMVAWLFYNFERKISSVLEFGVACGIRDWLIDWVLVSIIWHKLGVVRFGSIVSISSFTCYVLLHFTRFNLRLIVVVFIWGYTFYKSDLGTKMCSWCKHLQLIIELSLTWFNLILLLHFYKPLFIFINIVAARNRNIFLRLNMRLLINLILRE